MKATVLTHFSSSQSLGLSEVFNTMVDQQSAALSASVCPKTCQHLPASIPCNSTVDVLLHGMRNVSGVFILCAKDFTFFFQQLQQSCLSANLAKKTKIHWSLSDFLSVLSLF